MNFNKRIYLNDGCGVFLEKVKEKEPETKIYFRMDDNAEYVVYNSNQTRVKYILQIKNVRDYY